MTWLRLDNGFPDHPKVAAAGDLAGWLYVCGLAYASRLLTDGFIPAGVVPRLTGLDNPTALARTLVAVGLWEQAPGGYRIHDYLAYQVPSSRVQQDRDAARTRTAAWRQRQVSPTNSDLTTSQLPLAAPEHGDPEPDPAEALLAEAESLDREPNLRLLGQQVYAKTGWTATSEQIRKLDELARGRGADLVIESMKMDDWLKGPKGQGRACNFSFMVNWLNKEGTNGRGKTGRVSGGHGAGPRAAAARAGAGRAGNADPFTQYERTDPRASATAGKPPAPPS